MMFLRNSTVFPAPPKAGCGSLFLSSAISPSVSICEICG
jgi:hypothetical protein